ncbi:MAG TPA: hypothetical protein VGI48_08420 [Caldimonas sp.]|jgi:hypothetical protein
MRTHRLQASFSLLLLLALPSLANAANCYSVYDAQNRLTFQSTVSPVDLSTRISQAMRERFPGGYLIIVPDDADCLEFRTGPITSPRFDSGKVETSRDQVIEAPLLRGAPTAGSAEQGSGNNLTVRKR